MSVKTLRDINSFPEGILLKIFHHLRDLSRDIASISLTCKRWHACAVIVNYSSVSFNSQDKWNTFVSSGLLNKYAHHIESILFSLIDLSSDDKELLLNCCTSLTSIQLLKCKNLDSDFLRDWVKSNKKTLQSLRLWGPKLFASSVTAVTDDFLAPVLVHCTNLKELRIIGAGITDASLLRIATSPNSWHALEWIDLAGCLAVTGFGVAELFSPGHLPALKNLRLEFNNKNEMDVDFFEFLANSFPNYNFHIVVAYWYYEPRAAAKYGNMMEQLAALSRRKNNVSLERRLGNTTTEEFTLYSANS
ncbi:5601_t:CDS:1 [Paraglomus occultum]|uniref:5601_t:CDS:1 n=1 Tax=Paraglomus occultum TaxID=144539 RepID=A0A9N9ACT5_9GLOM|nr:5601_t:CDS:1 [Paraglomus occultum]